MLPKTNMDLKQVRGLIEKGADVTSKEPVGKESAYILHLMLGTYVLMNS